MLNQSEYLFQGIIACPECTNPLSVNRHINKRNDKETQFASYRCQNCFKSKTTWVNIGEKAILDGFKQHMREIEYDGLHKRKNYTRIN